MSRQYLSLDKFHSLAKEGNPPEQAVILAGGDVDVKSEDSEGGKKLTFTISTSSIDRAGDTINQDGWDLDAYRKNPVVLWAHDRAGLPIAKSEVWIEGGKLKALPEFVPKELSRFADAVRQYYERGFLKAASVGFLPTKWAWTEDKDRKFGIDFEKQELLEWSCVPVPANGEALAEAKSAGLDIAPIREWAIGALKATHDITSVRDFETFLRDAGFSRKEAVALASRGWNSLQRDADEKDIHLLAALFESQRNDIRRFLHGTR